MTIHSILGKNRGSCKAEYLSIVKEFHNLLMAIPEMAAMALIEYHHDTGMTNSLNLAAVPCLAYCGIKFLNGSNDNLGITLQAFYKFIRVIGTIHRTRLKKPHILIVSEYRGHDGQQQTSPYPHHPILIQVAQP